MKQKNKFMITGKELSTTLLEQIVRDPESELSVSNEVRNKINDSRNLLSKLIESGHIIYGVNTSMGGFVNWIIPTKYDQTLQENLISAVATNVGNYMSDDVVKASLLTRIHSLARGHSAISLENFLKLVEIYNAGIIPCIPEKGSLGTSGDLGPLACIALVGSGKWKAKYQNRILPGATALREANISPMNLKYKEGLAIINGTSSMTGFGALIIEDSINLIQTYDLISCLSFEVLKAKKKPFNPVVHEYKPHRGQLITAKNIYKILADSQMIEDEDSISKHLRKELHATPKAATLHIEDAYSIRCTPQIIGPIRDNIRYNKTVIENEINSSNDNPLILTEQNDVFHNGHFHGQYIAMAMDNLGLSLTTLCNLSDRRIDRFLDKNHSNNLPPFLCKEDPGLRLGLMGVQFLSASLTSENRSLCQPLSIQSLPSTEDFQDIVSLGFVAARRAKNILDNTYYVIAVELLCACQGADIRGPQYLSAPTRKLYELVRDKVPYLAHDEVITDYIESIVDLIKSRSIINKIKKLIGQLEF